MNRARSEAATVTPEAVALDLPLAGLGSRLLAAFVDALIEVGIVVAILAAGATFGPASISGGAVAVLSAIAFSVVLLGYPAIFEGVWEGRTPGKKAAGLRVLSASGQPVTWAQVLIRNVFRLVDQYLFVVIGAVSILVTPRSQRLGDLAAGTIVVHDEKASLPAPFEIRADEELERLAGTMDPAGVTEREYSILRSYLQRREQMRPGPRAELAAKLAEAFREKLGASDAVHPDEKYLEAIAISVRRRSGKSPQL